MHKKTKKNQSDSWGNKWGCHAQRQDKTVKTWGK